ncbi:hypothetical protein AGMMS49928_02040 [Spirochaetia bacterium]|nr:hypothetical protein AGMMS49928_02040 [Spirochaetia bacterium]
MHIFSFLYKTNINYPAMPVFPGEGGMAGKYRRKKAGQNGSLLKKLSKNINPPKDIRSLYTYYI